ncbi:MULTISPECIES: NUDIX hydrolase [unclassified Crossiella]|uniref:NUDIX hydrolase n=1 Tax=unclassified Crossiella TaxID=2620835 RepID=UPI001FFED5B9|nr:MULTISPECIES: NUDIX domain-containing protein [unclassified Crossiella]MCK2241895.1 NUDIX domain-containing protein [Crossiella sp. S99.2]MCK2255798.1 NUDIX domain-containing protein [Crossiella sp. S99.1]
MPTTSAAQRIGARVLLLDPEGRVLLVHARDPDEPAHHWWELPSGRVDEGESLESAARRELGEEAGIALEELGRKVFVRESRFVYRGRNHHRVDHVFLARLTGTEKQVQLALSPNEKAGVIERRWWSAADLRRCTDKLLPATLPELLEDVLADRLGNVARVLTD